MKAENATRIFVGGLGERVTKENLKTMFESVGGGGTVETIDIIRTKGRSFAYVNFCPYSDNFFPKLFSIYNGCVWKGGRLKLENAKEHYLSRLKREWEEDAQLVNCDVDATQTNNTSSTLDKVRSSLDNKQLQIFFPRLRKLKSLPLSGTGKHKYSFPRLEVSSSLPIHFCDCEEHYIPAFTGHENGEKKFDSEVRGEKATINDEIKLMKSVMNKLFEGEKTSVAGSGGTEPTSIEDNSIKLTSNAQFGETEVMSESDEDNFILNVVTSRSKISTAPLNKEKEIISNVQDVSKKQKLHIGHERKKLKSVVGDGTDRKKEVSTIEKGMMALLDKMPGDGSIFDEEPKNKKAAEWKLEDKQSGRGSSWLQKCSWTQLVGERNSSSFSITQIVPGLTPEKHIQTAPKVVNGATIDRTMKKDKVDGETKVSSQQPAGEAQAPAAPVLERVGAAKHADEAPAAPSLERVGAAKTAGGGDFVIGETCTFMRSAASLKDWAKNKAALNASLKRKRETNGRNEQRKAHWDSDSPAQSRLEGSVSHSNPSLIFEVILTLGSSRTVLEFLCSANEKKRSFRVFVAEGAPRYKGHLLAKELSSRGLQTTLITDSAVFAMISLVNMVIVGAHAVMTNGGVIVPVGLNMLALAAERHAVPFVVLAGSHKLCPLYPHNSEVLLNELRSPSELLDFGEFSDCMDFRSDTGSPLLHVVNPTFDYVPPKLVSLFITDSGGHNPWYMYRLIGDYYSAKDLVVQWITSAN